MEVQLTGHSDLAGFRDHARQLLAQQVPPEQVHWTLDLESALYRDPVPATGSRPRNVARAATAIVPASFTRLCEFVVLHRDPQRFSLLYRLLWRLVHEPGLRNDSSDPDMLQAQHMAHAVRRDVHKMKANLKLRTVRDAGGEPLQVGCHDPAHHVVEVVAPWLARNVPGPRWAVFTPDRSVYCEQGRLLHGPGVPPAALPGYDGPESAWQEIYAQVFAAPGREAEPAHA